MSAIVRFTIVASSLFVGCAPNLAAISSEQVGCAPFAMGISERASDARSRNWIASCAGRRFLCTSKADGSDATCGREPLVATEPAAQ